ncbi:DUF6691 family protein [Thaumasiovibrio sp. DFM-14]|uniref:DUF6691 family protein n=1 Tax=Thaumasiovibrio sp. DFM-14 TaxID=3384792 RepID=UPI0039A26680
MFVLSFSLLSGVIFGIGMMISGMVNPVKVIGFLDIAGEWDPTLAFVMGGALLVFIPFYFLLIRRCEKPIADRCFFMPESNVIDKKLLGGAALFGIGWGIAGICPGPAITMLGSGNLLIILFIIAMGAGLFITDKLMALRC